jgi:hypothetical protein
MNDKMGKLPKPKNKGEVLFEIRKIASDTRGHLLLEEHCDWLTLKLKAIRIMAFRGLKLDR